MNTLNQFEKDKQQAIDILSDLAKFVQTGEELGVHLHPEMIEKINRSIGSVKNEKLKVALIGGFSEGKTSIAAAWLERLDRQSMNISQQESSNEVKIYDVEEKLQIIDTPGLFGFKEKTNASTLEIEKYKDITKRYVSEAHLVLYVMNSTNPIKESHTEDLRWLFQTLNLLPRTVFVLSRFDEVADVSDEIEFQEQYAVKQRTVKQRLEEVLSLTPEERETISVVAVAANPFDKGVNYWLEHLEKFRKLSRITALQEATTDRIKANGGLIVIATETRKSVISDVLAKEIPAANANYQLLAEEVRRMSDIESTQSRELGNTKANINQARINLRGRIIRYFEGLQFQVKQLGQETFGEFMHREIGSEGVIINQTVQEIFNDEVSSIAKDLSSIQINVTNEINHFNDMVTTIGKQGIQYLAQPGMITKETVLMARDGIKTVAKAFGADLGGLLKFKPWGATKLANNLGSAIAVFGIAFEAWNSYKEHERALKFKEGIDQFCKNLEQQRKEIVALIDSDEFVKDFFPSYISLNEQLDEIRGKMADLKQRYQRFQQWCEAGKAIDVQFREISPQKMHVSSESTEDDDSNSLTQDLEDLLTTPTEQAPTKTSFFKRLFN